MAGRVLLTSVLSFAIMLAAALLLPLVGSTSVDYAKAIAGESPHREILFQVRAPRVLLALLTGGALSVSGVLFQALLRDSLATPYTLGISSGAALGAVAAICFNLGVVWPWAFAGAGATLVIVLMIASEERRMSSFTLLMSGITINSICLALILFLHSTSTFGQSFAIVRWLMGGIDPVEYSTLGWVGGGVIGGTALAFLRAPDWNLLAVGEEWASVRGVSTNRLLFTGYLLGSVLTGLVTALTGPIGFVGLIVPHAIRLALGADHRVLIPASFFLGATFLATCDTLARTLRGAAEVEVGVITAMLGGPFFIWILRRRRSL